MSAQLPGSVPISKGNVCSALDKISVDPNAKVLVAKLRDAINADGPNYPNLTNIFDLHALTPAGFNAVTRAQVVDHLNTFWFDPTSPKAYFPGVPVAKIYAEGVVKTLDLAANGPAGNVVPIDAWWLVDMTAMKLINTTRIEDGVTTGLYVTLYICTRRPEDQPGIAPTPPWILGRTSEAFVTSGDREHGVETARVSDLR
jgi:hypothetical protein